MLLRVRVDEVMGDRDEGFAGIMVAVRFGGIIEDTPLARHRF